MDSILVKNTRGRPKTSLEDKIYYFVVNAILLFFVIIVSYPIIYIVSSSFSSPQAVSTGRVVLFPVDLSLAGYKAVFSHRYILIGFKNTIFYTIAGTIINVAVTMIAAYPLSRRDMPLKGAFMALFVFTMFFGGGLIPTYILIKNLKMVNTFWVMIIPGAMSVYNMILARTFMISSIPTELLESTQIDGCSDTRYFFKIVLPLSKPVIAVIALFYAVGHWNSYFSALIYLNDHNLFPIQLFLREILVMNMVNPSEIQDPELLANMQQLSALLKYSLIVVSSAPVLLFYPMAQKHFIKGVMLGSLKG